MTPAIVKAIIAHHLAALPPEWKVETVSSRLRTGATYWREKRIEIPRLLNYLTLWIFFHEVGHALRIISGAYPLAVRRDPARMSANEEYHAEQHAIRQMKVYGLRVDRLVLADAKKYVQEWVAKDDAKGRAVEPRVRKWANS